MNELEASDLLDRLAEERARICQTQGHGRPIFDAGSGQDVCDQCGDPMDFSLLGVKVEFTRPDGLVRRITFENVVALSERASTDNPWSPPLEVTAISAPKPGRLTAVFERPDRHAFLIERWLDGRWTIAERLEPEHSWSPPLEGVEL